MRPERPEQLTRPAKFLVPLAILAVTAHPAAAVEFDFPDGASITLAAAEAPGSAVLPVAPWDGAAVPLHRAEGRVERRAVRIEGGGHTTLALIAPLRDQLAAAGFETRFACETVTCGGFDFRFAAGVLPEPEMHVDLGDFRYLMAERGDEVVALMVSRSANAGFVQVTRVVPLAGPPATVLAAAPTAAPVIAEAPAPGPVDGPTGTVSLSTAGSALRRAEDQATGTVTAQLDAGGRAVLADLVFDTGATALRPGDYASLAAVAAWLGADPDRQIALVGHTDASGGLDANIAISRRRAEAVRAALIEAHGIAPSRVTAEGVGFLVPLASNATEEGRSANRRVEAVVVTDD